jgi:hypothetical protein
MVRSFPAVVAVSILLAGAGLAGCGGSSPGAQAAGPASSSASAAAAAPANPAAAGNGQPGAGPGGPKHLRSALAYGHPHRRRPSRSNPFRYH